MDSTWDRVHGRDSNMDRNSELSGLYRRDWDDPKHDEIEGAALSNSEASQFAPSLFPEDKISEIEGCRFTHSQAECVRKFLENEVVRF